MVIQNQTNFNDNKKNLIIKKLNYFIYKLFLNL